MSHYDILGIQPDASESMIKKAYRELSFKNHPDRNPSPEASVRMREINEAYEVLSDAQKRKQYDTGSNGSGNPLEDIINELFKGHGHGPSQPFPGMFQVHHVNMGPQMGARVHQVHMTHGQPINIFEMMQQMHMGENMHFEDMARPEPLDVELEITLEQAYKGHNSPLTIEREVNNGKFNAIETEKVYVATPPGIDNGEIIQIEEKRHVLRNYKSPLRVHIKIKPHDSYERKGLNLLYKHTLSFKESICGFDFTFQQLDGTSLKIKNNVGNIIQNMDEKVLKLKGMTRDGITGDLTLQFKVLPSKPLTEEQIAVLLNVL
jgi:DnaJ-class molecular chaperone